MKYEQKDFSNLLGLKGFSDLILTSHFSLYGGYVRNVNGLMDLLKTTKINSPEFNELKRRFGWEWNGVKMHELYFENLSKATKPLDKDSILFIEINKQFGSYEKCLEDFKATGLIRGIGWVALVKDSSTGNLMNLWINEHDGGHLCDQQILLAMDVWEHAYITDYGIKRVDYINAFIESINWQEVEKRFKK